MQDVTKWTKNCPKCGKEQTYSRKSFLLHSIRKNVQCRDCMFNSKEYRNQHTKNSTNMWKTKREDIVKKRNTKEAKEKWMKSALITMRSASYKDKQSKLQKQLLIDNSIRILENAEKIKQMWNDKNSVYHTKEFRSLLSEAIKSNWKRPEIRKKMFDALDKTKWLKVRTDIGQLKLIEKWNRLGFNFEPNYQLHKGDFLAYLDGYDKEKNIVLEYDSKYHNRSSQKQKDQTRQQKIIDILNPKKFWRYSSKTNRIENVLERCR